MTGPPSTTFLRHVPFVVWATLVYIATVLIVVLPTIYMYDPTSDEDFINSTTQSSSSSTSSEIGNSVDDLIVFLLFCVPLAATVNAVFVYCFYYRHIRFMFYHLEQCQIENMLLSAATREMLSMNGPASSAFLLKSAGNTDETNNNNNKDLQGDGDFENGNPLGDSPSMSTNTTKLRVNSNNSTKNVHKVSPSKVIISSANNATKVPTYLTNNDNSINAAQRTESLYSFGHGIGAGNYDNNLSFDSGSSSSASPIMSGGRTSNNDTSIQHQQNQSDEVVSNASIFGQRVADTDAGDADDRTPIDATLGGGSAVPNNVELASFEVTHHGNDTKTPKKMPSCLKKKQAKLKEQPSTLHSVAHECSVLEKLKECNITPLQLYEVDGDGNEPVSHAAGDDGASPLHSRMKRSATFYMSGGRAAGGAATKSVGGGAMSGEFMRAGGGVDVIDGSPQIGPNAVFVSWATTTTTDQEAVAEPATPSAIPKWKRETAHLMLCHPAHPVEVERFQRMSIITRSLHKKVRPELCRQLDGSGGQCIGGSSTFPPTATIHMNDGTTANNNNDTIRPHRSCPDNIPKARISHMYCCECFGDENQEDGDGNKKDVNSGWCGQCIARVGTDGRSPGMKWLILDPQMARMLDESQATIERAFLLRRNIALQLNSLFAIKSVAELHHLNTVHFPPSASTNAAAIGAGGAPSTGGALNRGRSMRRQ